MSTLILFDVDGTLILTGGAGGRAVRRAFAELFQVGSFEAVPMAGRTDRWIFTELAARHGCSTAPATLARLHDVYLRHLQREIAVDVPGKGVLPGVATVLDVLDARADVQLGLLTGNIAEGARVKLEHFGLWRYFRAGGFGDVALDRPALLTDALTSVARVHGVHYRAEDTVVVGDTPLDVEVAVRSGARSLAVATGMYTAEALHAAGADAVLTDLSNPARVLDALGLPLTSV
ncbi:MAG: HAD family hydrolase [Vicinamibacterales bacterium]